jgi:AcrR family transcriptional regulator
LTDGQSFSFKEQNLAIIVDKEKKKAEIALACKDLIISSNINSLTISAIAKEAGIGKGTFYEYFKDKYELIFELVSILLQEYNKITEAKLKEATNIKDKLKIFASFYYDSDYKELRELYNQFIAISIISSDKEMLEFQTECFNKYKNWLRDILESEVREQNLPKMILDIVDILFITVDGLYITSITTNAISNLEDAINNYIEFMITLIKEN